MTNINTEYESADPTNFVFHRKVGKMRDVWVTYRPLYTWPNDLVDWIYNTLGQPGFRYSPYSETPKNYKPPHKRVPGESRWDYHDGKIILNNEQDVILFTLRWS